VLHFLTTRPLRDPDRQVGSYIPTSQGGHASIRRELLTYFREITPGTQTLADKFQTETYLHPKSEEEVYSRQDGWMKVLVERLGKYELTKGEVVMVLNLGLGLEDWQGRMPPRLRGGEDGVRSAEEQRVSDEWVLGAVCEELEQRFGPEEIQAILKTVGEVVREGKGDDENGVGAGAEDGGPVADRAHRMVSEWRARGGMDGVDESEDAGLEQEQLEER
jgi:hypothetical protein